MRNTITLMSGLSLLLSGCQSGGSDQPVAYQIGHFIGYSMIMVVPLVVVSVIIYFFLRLRDRSKSQ